MVFKVGDEVAIEVRGEVVGFTRIDKVRTRLGEVVGYATTNGRNWNRRGVGNHGDTWSREHIVLATREMKQKLAARVRRGKFIEVIDAVARSRWESVPTDALAEIVGILDRAKVESEEG